VTTTITTSAAAARAVVIQPDGKIIAVGNNWNGSDQDPTLVRYLSSGLLDPTFGSGGIVATKSPNPGSYIETAALQADGKIVVGGYMSNGTYAVFLVGRYNNDGSPDMSFGGTSGFVGMDFGGSAYLNAIAVQPDGKIVVAGSAWNGGGNSIALVRYTNNGSTIDATFGSGGVVRTPIGSDDDVASSIAIAPDGKIVVGGTTWNQATGTFDLVLVRYQSNGLLDTEFGSGGKATLFTGSTNDHASFVALQADGAVVLAGTRSLTGAPTDLILCRYRGNGSLDTGFGTNGTVTTAIGTIGDEANAIAIQTDGKITVAGSTSNGTKTSFALLRYNP
jgi:uncharacterized delta-60 repeat protein